MKKLLALFALLLAPSLALAQNNISPGSRGHLPVGTGCVYWLAPPAGGSVLLKGQPSPYQCDTRGNLRIVNMDGAGNARAANVSAANELLIGGAGTAGSPSAAVVTVQGIASGTVLPANVSQINGVALLAGNGATGTGSPRVTLVSDGTAISTAGFMSVKIDQTTPGTTNLVALAANQSVNVAQINGVTPLMGNGATGTGSPRVTLVSDGTAVSTAGFISVKFDQTTVGTTNAASVAAINAATALAGNGATGTGSLRVTLASDNSAVSGLGAGATGSAVPANAIYAGLSDGTNLRGQLQAANALNSTGTGIATAQIVGQFDDSSPTAITENQFGNLRMSTNRNLYGTIRDAAGNERGANVNANSALLTALDQTTVGTTNAVSLAQIGATTVVNCGLAGCLSVGGATATNVAITDNPINTGFQAISSENAAVTTARKVQGVADLTGKQIVLPYANPENFVSGVTAAMTGTTTTSVIAAPAAGLRNYITQCTFSNSHASVGTIMNLQDGSGGTTIYSAPAAALFGGATITFPTPLRQPTTATALFVANVTTGSNTFVACSGYKGA